MSNQHPVARESTNPATHHAQRHRTLAVMTMCEALAFACSLAAALPANSLILWANCLRIGLDLPASLFALHVSSRILRGKDGRFDYGLGKWENLASLVNVPAMLVGLAFLGFRAAHSFLHPQPVAHTGWGFGVLLVFGAINLAFLFRFRRLDLGAPSPLAHAQFILYRNATAASGLSLAALLGAQFAGAAGAYFDIVGAMFLAGLIVQSAVLLVRQSLSSLLDETVEEALQMHITRGLVKSLPNYHQLHRVRSRRAGSCVFIELFLEFDPRMSIGEMLQNSRRIQDEITKSAPHAEVTIIPCEGSPATSETTPTAPE